MIKAPRPAIGRLHAEPREGLGEVESEIGFGQVQVVGSVVCLLRSSLLPPSQNKRLKSLPRLPSKQMVTFSNVRTMFCNRGAECKDRHRCTYAHDANELQPIPAQIPVCRFKIVDCANEDCKRGVSCWYRHQGEQIIRSPDELWCVGDQMVLQVTEIDDQKINIRRFPKKTVLQLRNCPSPVRELVNAQPAGPDDVMNEFRLSKSISSYKVVKCSFGWQLCQHKHKCHYLHETERVEPVSDTEKWVFAADNMVQRVTGDESITKLTHFTLDEVCSMSTIPDKIRTVALQLAKKTIIPKPEVPRPQSEPVKVQQPKPQTEAVKQSSWFGSPIANRHSRPVSREASPLRLDMFECPVCYDRYDEKEHKALSINGCGHSVCKLCCSQLSNCPECNNPIRGTTTNIALMRL